LLETSLLLHQLLLKSCQTASVPSWFIPVIGIGRAL
jgi:hypothetical protein